MVDYEPIITSVSLAKWGTEIDEEFRRFWQPYAMSCSVKILLGILLGARSLSPIGLRNISVLLCLKMVFPI